MKTYQVELKRTSYITVHVQANDKDQAEELAWKEIEHNATAVWDASWEIEYIEEMDWETKGESK